MYNHFGDSQTTLNYNEIGALDMRTIVGHLTRNI